MQGHAGAGYGRARVSASRLRLGAVVGQPSFSAYTAATAQSYPPINFTYENSVYSRQKGRAVLDSGVAEDELMILVIRANINQKGQEDHLLHHSCSVVLMLSWRWQRLVGLPSDAISNGRRHRASREHEIQLRSTWRLLLLLSLLPA